MTIVDTFFAVAAAMLAGVVFYLGAPRQQWRLHPLPRRVSRIIGLILVLTSLAFLRRHQQPATALLSLLILLMATFVALPYLAALWQILKTRKP